jgi:hypothetical protein
MSSAVKISSICRAQDIVELLFAEEWDVIALVLAVFTTEGSQNNLIGVPLKDVVSPRFVPACVVDPVRNSER